MRILIASLITLSILYVGGIFLEAGVRAYHTPTVSHTEQTTSVDQDIDQALKSKR